MASGPAPVLLCQSVTDRLLEGREGGVSLLGKKFLVGTSGKGTMVNYY